MSIYILISVRQHNNFIESCVCNWQKTDEYMPLFPCPMTDISLLQNAFLLLVLYRLVYSSLLHINLFLYDSCFGETST